MLSRITKDFITHYKEVTLEPYKNNYNRRKTKLIITINYIYQEIIAQIL